MSTLLRGASADVRAAMEVRATALEAGFDAAVRPADIAALGATHHPLQLAGLSAPEAAHLQSLTRDALTGLQPRIIHTTGTSSVERMFAMGGRIPNVYDMLELPASQRPKLMYPVEQALESRANLELGHGMFGTGTNVYGTVHFADVQHDPMIGHAGELRQRNPAWATGSQQFGDVGVVLRPTTLDRASFLPGDTGVSGGRQLRAREELDAMLSERIASNFRMGDDPAGGWGTTDTPFGDFREVRDLQRELRDILAMPRKQAVAAIREHLTSTAMGEYYAEAQVRWADVADIEELHVLRPWKGIPTSPELAAHVARQDALIATARARGVTVHVSDQPVPQGVRDATRAAWFA